MSEQVKHLAGLRAFANEMIQAALDGGDMDGGSIQEAAVKHGLLAAQQMPAPCCGPEDGYCRCAYTAEFPAECFRPTAAMTDGATGATDAVRDVLAERQRQVTAEGWTPSHDDEHACDEIAAFACFYAMPPAARDWDASSTGYGETLGEAIKPVDWQGKTGDRRRELIKAGALILAEIERIDRASAGRVLLAYQVGDNDIVAAYDPAGAIQMLVDFAGYGEDFDVELVSDKMLDNTEAYDQGEGKIITLEKTLRQELAELTEPAYLHGWE